MTEAEIRPARAEDEQPLRQLELDTWSSDSSPSPPPARTEPFLHLESDDVVLVAVADGEIVGDVKIGPSLEVESNRHVVEIKGLAVDPGRQGQGIGRQLIEAAIGTAVAEGKRRLRLRVLGPNTRAQALYRSCGFEVEGVLREEFMLDGEYVDDILMAIDLAKIDGGPIDRRERR